MNTDLKNKGFVIVPDVFDVSSVSKMREVSKQYFNSGGGFANSGGRAKPDWIKEDKLVDIKDIIDSANLESIVSSLIDESVEFIEHNDLHINRSVGWHKDRLNGEARKFEITNPWDSSEDTMKIYKVNIYLQDHIKNNDCLTLNVGSHKSEVDTKVSLETIHPKSGDIVIFDQRISHMANYSGGYDRILICMGYGVKNKFFEEFKRGTEFRQNLQNGVI
jgi:hypothetical protein